MAGNDLERHVAYQLPTDEQIQLPIPPRLASWDAKTHASQVRLTEYLDSVESVVVNRARDSLALRLTVGLPEGSNLLEGGRDLDNYLYPLVQRLGSNRFTSAWAEKLIGPSTLSVGPAVPSTIASLLSAGWSWAVVRTRKSASTSAWKEEIAGQLGHVDEAPEGPLELQLSFLIGPRRNWANLWKPAIDALEAILGPGPRPFHPRDDRVIRLGLHRSLDAALNNQVSVAILWRAAEI
jgi:hypothetical protein